MFTPWSALAGGVVVGIAAAMLVLLNGRIAGVAGIIGGVLRPAGGDMAWRLAFIIGLLVAPAVYGLLAEPVPQAGHPQSLTLTLPPLAALILKVPVYTSDTFTARP